MRSWKRRGLMMTGMLVAQLSVKGESLEPRLL